MKKYAVIIVSLVAMLNVYPNNTIAKEYTLSADCKEEIEQRHNQFLDSVFDDVLNTYQYLNTEKDDDNVFYFTMEELFHIITLIGESNESIDSLNQFFIGESMG
ncbi:hypothetical protein GLW20_04480 [Virgibacillus halodenitrificans]|nr:hypothetical protein [Virgibacillus halodenitrificans]